MEDRESGASFPRTGARIGCTLVRVERVGTPRRRHGKANVIELHLGYMGNEALVSANGDTLWHAVVVRPGVRKLQRKCMG